MPIIATCPRCRQSYQVDEQFAGRKANCQSCGQPFVVPQPVPVDVLSASAELQSGLSPIPSNEYGLAPVSGSSNPLGRGTAGFGAAATSAGPAVGASSFAASGSRSGSDGTNFYGGEAVDWAMKPGITCSILGVGGFLLPLMGVQFRVLQLLGAAAPIVAGLLAIVGAGLLFLALKDNLIKALAASGTVMVLAFGAFVIATLASGAQQPANNLAQPLPRPGNQPAGGGPPGAPPGVPMNVAPAQPQAIGAAGPALPLAPQAALAAPPESERPTQFVTPDQLLDPASGLPALTLEPPTTALPKVALNAGDSGIAMGSLRHALNGQPDFRDETPPGGWLVGLRVVQGRNWGGAICGVQPIYQVEGQYVLGEFCGRSDGVSQTVRLARPGFAVSGLRCNIGLVMNALQLEFSQVSGQRMVADGAYKSEWIGCKGGDMYPPMSSQGEPIIGLDGTAKEDLTGLRLICMPTKQAP